MRSVGCCLSLTCLVICSFAAPVSAQLPDWLGTIDVSPLRHDALATVGLSGVWIDTCVPDLMEAAIEPGRIDLLLDVPALNVGCGDALTEWSIDRSLGPLTPWTSYDVYGTVEMVDPSDRTLRQHMAGPDLLIEAYAWQMPGDFDQNGQIDAVDADLLGAAERSGGPLDPFDLNADGKVDFHDRVFWLHGLSLIPAGDADQNGRFDSGDLVKVFQSGEYADQIAMNSSWVTGDWNGDAEFDSGDLVFALGYACYQDRCCDYCADLRTAQPAVPEPVSGLTSVMACLMIMVFRRTTFLTGSG